MITKAYKWGINVASHQYALFTLFVVSFIESSIFPIPPDVILIPMILAVRRDAWRIAFVCTIASVLGGIAGYYIGHFLFDEIGRSILEFYNYDLKFEEFKSTYNEWGAWAVFIAGVTPFPYKVITILSGVAELNIYIFVVASIMARGLRFFILAWLLWKFGKNIRGFIEKRLGLLFVLFCCLLIGSFFLIKLFLCPGSPSVPLT